MPLRWGTIEMPEHRDKVALLTAPSPRRPMPRRAGQPSVRRVRVRRAVRTACWLAPLDIVVAILVAVGGVPSW